MPIPNGYCTWATDLFGLGMVVVPLLLGAFVFWICTSERGSKVIMYIIKFLIRLVYG